MLITKNPTGRELGEEEQCSLFARRASSDIDAGRCYISEESRGIGERDPAAGFRALLIYSGINGDVIIDHSETVPILPSLLN